MNTHLLISPAKEKLRRWSEAFPDGRAVDSIEAAKAVYRYGDVVWLHVPDDARGAVALLRGATKQLAGAKLVAVADIPDDEQALALLESGALGYCHAHAAPQMLQQVATVIINKGLWVGPGLLLRMLKGTVKALPEAPDEAADLSLLSEREQAVALCVADGQSNKEIANELGITPRTVKAHITSIFSKLKVRDRVHLALKIKSGS